METRFWEKKMVRWNVDGRKIAMAEESQPAWIHLQPFLLGSFGKAAILSVLQFLPLKNGGQSKVDFTGWL